MSEVDETSRLSEVNDESMISAPGVGDETLDSIAPSETNDSAATPSAKRSQSRLITADVTHRPVEVKDVFEYEWPLKSGERWFLQEQISDLLGITSFKRRYPDMQRRLVEVHEKDHLTHNYKLTELLNEHQLNGLTALRAVEVHDLMSNEHAGLYTELQRAIADRIKQQMLEKQMELDSIKNDSKKLAELRAKAIKSAFEYNAELNKYKKAERQGFWDLQTSIIQTPVNKWKRLPAEYTRPSPYPVTLIHGQFQEYYKKFTPEEMRKLPLGSVLDGEHLFPVVRERSPPPIVVDENELNMTEAEKMAAELSSVKPLMDAKPASPLFASIKSEPITTTPRRSNSLCQLCNGGARADTTLLKCANCTTHVHSYCIEMSDEMVDVVLGYAWNCIECKKCIVCQRPDQEEAMMFCDRCDRGYHTHCVGLKAPPTGVWICKQHCEKEKNVDKAATPAATPNSRSTRSTARGNIAA